MQSGEGFDFKHNFLTFRKQFLMSFLYATRCQFRFIAPFTLVDKDAAEDDNDWPVRQRAKGMALKMTRL